MCINVFEKEIDIYYRYVCLLPFLVVIILSNNIITYILLGIMLFIGNMKKDNILFLIMIIITFICFFINNLLLIKIVLMIDFLLYFIIDNKKQIDNNFDSLYYKNKEKISNILKKGEIDDKIMNEVYIKTKNDIKMKQETSLLRFKKNKYYNQKDNLNNILYVSFHLIILFMSILIGSCVI